MHIPAMDSLRHERVGLVTDGPMTMVLQAYVKTDATDERGAEDPIEGMARPFPLMYRSTETSVLEPYIMSSEIEAFSDSLVEYTALLYESIRDGEWVDGVDDFEDDDFASSDEFQVAHSLFSFAASDRPRTLVRVVYEAAHDRYSSDEAPDGLLRTNPLYDVEGRERYDFAYLPLPEDLDIWTITRARYDGYNEEVGEDIVTESLWLRYTQGDTEAELPLVVYNNEYAGVSAASKDVEFGNDMEADSVDPAIVRTVLGLEDADGTAFSDVSDELEGTRTNMYLQEYSRME